MLTPEDMKLLSDLMDKKLEPINTKLNDIEERLDGIEEDTEITRATVNEIVEWIDFNLRDKYPFPVGTEPKKIQMN